MVGEQSYTFFFYGTLCILAVLARVLGHNCEDLDFQDVILPGYTRHCVKGEDYPAVVDEARSKKLIPEEQLHQPLVVQGQRVSGLSAQDVEALDVFEGDQYTRQECIINPTDGQPSCPNGPNAPVDHTSDADPKQEQKAWTYVWTDSLDDLDSEQLSLEDFVRMKAAAWGDEGTTEFDEVERYRALLQKTSVDIDRADADLDDKAYVKDDGEVAGTQMEGYPDFGHNMLQYWNFRPGYINLNHVNLGSYGSPPIPVIQSMRNMSDQIESAPDLFMRRTYLPLLISARERIAKLIGATSTDEVVLVPSASQGVDLVLWNIDWEDGDVILMYTTTYGAVGQMVKYICDRHKGVTLVVVNIDFPCSHEHVVSETERVLAEYNLPTGSDHGELKAEGVKADKRIRMVVVDSIASNPGVIYPWERIVSLCKKYGVLSLVDGAHSIGQQSVTLKKADPDFFITNCHKWLMAHRAVAVLYVPFRNQHLIRTGFPTSIGYESTKYPTEGIDRPWFFTNQFVWTGTPDFTPTFSVMSAMDFREQIGGEKRIMEYCHDLAVRGGNRVFKRWKTQIMENPEGELTAAMVNVQLPDCPNPKNLEEQFKQLRYMEDSLFRENCFVPPYRHAGKWWARFSAQVWNDLSDFDRVAEVLEGICEGIRKGEHLHHVLEGKGLVNTPADLPTHDE